MVKHLTTLFQELPTKEFAVAVVISSFVSDNGIIKHNSKEVTGKDICNMLGDNYETFNRVITKLTRKGILGRVRIPDEIFKFHELKHFCSIFLQENSRYIFCNKKINIKITENFEYNRRYLGKSYYKKKKLIIWKQ